MFLTLLHKRLEKNRDGQCYPLRRKAVRGALLKVTLTSLVYIVAVKGAVAAFVKDLQHERQIY